MANATSTLNFNERERRALLRGLESYLASCISARDEYPEGPWDDVTKTYRRELMADIRAARRAATKLGLGVI